MRPRAGLDVCGNLASTVIRSPNRPVTLSRPVRKTEYRKELNEKIWLNTHSISTTPAPNEEALIKTADKVHGLSSVAAPRTVASWHQKPSTICRDIA